MDEDFERARRAVRENLEDVGAAIRFAAACERAGRFDDAWTTLVRFVGRSGEERVVLGELAGLARRHPAATIAYLRSVDSTRARFSCLALKDAGELLPLTVIACEVEDGDLAFHSQVALRRALAPTFEALPGVRALGFFVRSQDPRDWAPYILRVRTLFRGYDALELLAEMGFVRRAEPGIVVSPLGQFAGAPYRDLAQWTDYARALVERASSENRPALLPWLASLSGAADTHLAAAAVVAFQRLAGRLGPPLDPDDLARRWPRAP